MLITEECNLRCDYCYIRKRPRTMTNRTAEQSVDFLFEASAGTRSGLSITFFGGEPLLAPGLIELIHAKASERARESSREISFSMTTNATLISERNAELIERLGIAVRVSLDGVGWAHDLHRRTVAGKGSFALITRNLARIARLKSVSVRMTVSPETARQLPEAVQWLSDQGFASISFSPVAEAAWTEEALGELLEAQRHLRSIQQSQRAPLNHIGKMERALKSTGPRWGCGAARGLIAVDSEGYLYPCHRFVGYFRNGAAQRIGHVATGFDIPKREHYIAANHSTSRRGCGHGLFATGISERTCQNCSLLSLCGSNCMAVSEHMTGDPTRPHPINRLLAQIDAAAHLNFSSNSSAPIVPELCSHEYA